MNSFQPSSKSSLFNYHPSQVLSTIIRVRSPINQAKSFQPQYSFIIFGVTDCKAPEEFCRKDLFKTPVNQHGRWKFEFPSCAKMLSKYAHAIIFKLFCIELNPNFLRQLPAFISIQYTEYSRGQESYI